MFCHLTRRGRQASYNIRTALRKDLWGALLPLQIDVRTAQYRLGKIQFRLGQGALQEKELAKALNIRAAKDVHCM